MIRIQLHANDNTLTFDLYPESKIVSMHFPVDSLEDEGKRLVAFRFNPKEFEEFEQIVSMVGMQTYGYDSEEA